jgi:hypothetical protein
MAVRHGNKTYLQILIDPNRAALVNQLAEEAGMRPSAWVREAVYKMLQLDTSGEVYNEALEKDKEVWQESVRRRVEGRMRLKKD